MTPAKRYQLKMLQAGRCRQCGRKRKRYAHLCDKCQVIARKTLAKWRKNNGRFSAKRQKQWRNHEPF